MFIWLSNFLEKQVEWNRKSYSNRKSKGLWLNRKQRIKEEYGDQAAKLYEAWCGMKTRVKAKGKKNRCYSGVEIDPYWLADFNNFACDMGLPPEGHSLDRIDGTKGYSFWNCRWADAKTQGRNTSKSKITLQDAEEIRRIYAEGKISQQVIADSFGILQVSVSQILRNKIWVP